MVYFLLQVRKVSIKRIPKYPKRIPKVWNMFGCQKASAFFIFPLKGTTYFSKINNEFSHFGKHSVIVTRNNGIVINELFQLPQASRNSSSHVKSCHVYSENFTEDEIILEEEITGEHDE